MKNTEFYHLLEKALDENQISNFVATFIGSKAKGLSDSELLDEIFEDAIMMGTSVKGEDDLETYIGAQNVVPFFTSKLGINFSSSDLRNIYSEIVSQKIKNTADVGSLIFNYANKKRVAYPMSRTWGTPIVKIQNVEDWIARLDKIYKYIKKGAQKSDAIESCTSDLDSYEKGMFDEWMRYYEENAHKKYSMEKNKMKKIAENFGNQEYLQMLNDALSAKDKQEKKMEKKKEDSAKAREQKRDLKKKMLSRLRSLDRLIDNYFLLDDEQHADDIGSPEQVNQKTKSVESLTKAVTDLKSALQGVSTASNDIDKMYKVAAIAKECKMKDIYDETIKVAQEFENKALEVDKQNLDPSPNLAGMEKEFDDSPSLEETKSKAEPKNILDKLERLQRFLKERSLARELSEVDVMLGELDLSAYFPELGECQAKILDALSYSSSKVETAISKLRAGLSEKDKEEEQVQVVPEKRPQPVAEDVKIVPGEPELATPKEEIK